MKEIDKLIVVVSKSKKHGVDFRILLDECIPIFPDSEDEILSILVLAFFVCFIYPDKVQFDDFNRNIHLDPNHIVFIAHEAL